MGVFKNVCEKKEGSQFSNKPIKCFGLYVRSDQAKYTSLNYESKMEKDIENGNVMGKKRSHYSW